MNASFATLIQQRFATHRTLILYFFIGVSASLIDVVGFYVFFSVLNISSPLATTGSVLIATVYAFLLNAHYNFKMTDSFWVRFASYAVVSGIGLVISAFSLWLFNVRMGFDGNMVKILSLPVIFLVQYLLNKRITFQSFAHKY